MYWVPQVIQICFSFFSFLIFPAFLVSADRGHISIFFARIYVFFNLIKSALSRSIIHRLITCMLVSDKNSLSSIFEGGEGIAYMQVQNFYNRMSCKAHNNSPKYKNAHMQDRSRIG